MKCKHTLRLLDHDHFFVVACLTLNCQNKKDSAVPRTVNFDRENLINDTYDHILLCLSAALNSTIESEIFIFFSHRRCYVTTAIIWEIKLSVKISCLFIFFSPDQTTSHHEGNDIIFFIFSLQALTVVQDHQVMSDLTFLSFRVSLALIFFFINPSFALLFSLFMRKLNNFLMMMMT